MCGRFSRFTGQDILINRFGVDKTRSSVIKSYNIAPNQDISVIYRENPVVLEKMKWGFIPFFAKDKKSAPTPINARDDSLIKNMYKYSFESKRCLIPANGFYEWKRHKGRKQPYHIHFPNMELFAFGGIYSSWQNENDETIRSFAIITTSPNEFMKDIHDRMPLIINREDEQNWINFDTDMKAIRDLVKPYQGELIADLVSKVVNSPKNDSPKCIEPIEEEDLEREDGQGILDDFF